jgi:hypothetical protein
MMTARTFADELAELIDCGAVTVLPDKVTTTPPRFPAMQYVSESMFRIWTTKGRPGVLVSFGMLGYPDLSRRVPTLFRLMYNCFYGQYGHGYRGPPAPGEFLLGGIAETGGGSDDDDELPPLEDVPT